MGFDSSDKLIQALRDGEIHGLVMQNPYRMGYDGVKTAVSFLRDGDFKRHIDTGVYMVTKENLEDPGIKKLLDPTVKSVAIE